MPDRPLFSVLVVCCWPPLSLVPCSIKFFDSARVHAFYVLSPVLSGGCVRRRRPASPSLAFACSRCLALPSPPISCVASPRRSCLRSRCSLPCGHRSFALWRLGNMAVWQRWRLCVVPVRSSALCFVLSCVRRARLLLSLLAFVARVVGALFSVLFIQSCRHGRPRHVPSTFILATRLATPPCAPCVDPVE